MERSKYAEAFHVQKFLMSITGLWPKKNFGTWYTIYGFTMSFILQVVFMMPSVATVFSQSTSVASTTFTLFIMITIFTYGIKVSVIYFKRNTFHAIIDDLEQPLFNDYDIAQDVYMKKAIWIANTTRSLIQFPCVFIILFVSAFPIFDKGGTKRPLPFEMPINTEALPLAVYIVGYLVQVVASAACASNNANIDTLACSFIALGTAQLQILRETLKALASKSNRTGGWESYGKWDEDVARKIKDCVKHHISITAYVDKLEQMFTYIFLAQFLTSVIVICLTGFGLLVIPVTDMLFAASVSYFTAIVGEISIYCLFGDELMAQSLKIGDACYSSEWNNCGPSIRKSMMIIMERSKRPLHLTAGKFTVLSRDSLVTILKSSLSYFAVLRKLYDDE